MAKNSNGKKRQSPSVERQLALALVAVIEACRQEAMSILVGTAVEAADAVLKANDYGDLESIAIRVKRIKAEMSIALEADDGAKLAQLGAALDRAKKGLPPLTAEKKPRKPRTPKTPPAETPEKKTRKKKNKDAPASLPLGDGSCKCIYPGCTWTGPTPADMACPVCGTEVVADSGGKVVVA